MELLLYGLVPVASVAKFTLTISLSRINGSRTQAVLRTRSTHEIGV